MPDRRRDTAPGQHFALPVGTRPLCAYVQSLLGWGGMGEVYRARDFKLGRDVAIKILPAAFAADPDRLGRFSAKRRMLASLNHPHIARSTVRESTTAFTPS